MRISLALGNRDAIDQQLARVCAATNLGLPGFGSLMAGRVVGYAQAVLTVAGFALTMILGVRFIAWGVTNWSRLYGPEANPLETLSSIWLNLRGALLGIALFVVSWLWALATSFAILRGVPKNAGVAKPPKLT